MLRPPVRARRIRATLVAAVGCGVLGGGLIGVGAVGFQQVAGAATPCAVSPTPTPTPEPAPDPTPVTDPETAPALEPEQESGSVIPETATAAEAELADIDVGPLGHDTTVVPGVGALKPCEPDPVTVPAPDVPVATPSLPTPIPAQPTPRPPVVVVPTPAPVNPTIPPPSTTTRGFSKSSRPTSPTPGRTGTITRPEVIARAVSWVTQAVPYSQVRWWTDANGTYRQDCSGYVSMSWRTDQRINYWTGNLATISERIASKSLQPGDALVLPGRHTVLFAGWANAQRTKFNLFEEYATGRPARFVRNAALGYYLDRGYGAYEYDGIRDVLTVPQVPIVTPSPPITGTPPDTTTAPNQAALILASSSTELGLAQSWNVDQVLAGVPSTQWTPAEADSYVPEDSTVVAPSANGDELSLAAMPIQDLISAQRAVDRAEESRLSATRTEALTVTARRTSGAGYVLAAGFGLVFIAIPLGAMARRGWISAGPLLPTREEN